MDKELRTCTNVGSFFLYFYFKLVLTYQRYFICCQYSYTYFLFKALYGVYERIKGILYRICQIIFLYTLYMFQDLYGVFIYNDYLYQLNQYKKKADKTQLVNKFYLNTFNNTHH